MASTSSDGAGGVSRVAGEVTESVKILVVGDLGVGKTTLIGSVSEIVPLRTEEILTRAGVGVDALQPLDGKTTTTVAMDFGRRTLPGGLVLYLFGAPGQRRFWPAWPGLADGAVGALVLVDTRRLEGTFAVLDQLEEVLRLPYAVVVNRFPDTAHHPPGELREALDLPADTPVVECDARHPRSSLDAVAVVVRHARDKLLAREATR